MNGLAEFVSTLLSDLFRMPEIMFEDVFLSDPLSAIAVIFGGLFIVGAVVVFAYAILGAVIQAIGGPRLPAPGRGRSG